MNDECTRNSMANRTMNEGENIMENAALEELYKDIDRYEEAISNAEGALAEAERELTEELERRRALAENV